MPLVGAGVGRGVGRRVRRNARQFPLLACRPLVGSETKRGGVSSRGPWSRTAAPQVIGQYDLDHWLARLEGVAPLSDKEGQHEKSDV